MFFVLGDDIVPNYVLAFHVVFEDMKCGLGLGLTTNHVKQLLFLRQNHLTVLILS